MTDRFVGLATGTTAVLLMTEEPPATVEEKVDRFGLDEDRVFVLSKRRLGGRKWAKIVAAAAEFCRKHPEIGVVVVDTWDKFVDLDARRSEADTGVIRESIDPLYELLDLGVCVFLITHQRKEEGSFGLRVRGGTALVGSADVIVEIERPNASAGLSKDARVVKIVSRFAGAPDEIAVELDEEGWRSLGTVAAAAKRSRREEVLELLADEPRTADEVTAGGGLGESKVRTVRRRLDELVELGLALAFGSGTRGDPRRWAVSENGRIFRDSFRTADFGAADGESPNPADRGESEPSGLTTDSRGARGRDECPETAVCPRHGGERGVVRRTAGLIYLACGCHLPTPHTKHSWEAES